jgi:hypothetical protein
MADQPLAKTSPTQKASKSQAEDKIKLPMWAWIVIAGGGAYFAYRVYKDRQAQAAAQAAAPTTVNGTAASTGCTDQNGNPTPCNTVTPVYNQINNLGPMEQQQYQTLQGQYQNIEGTLGAIQGQTQQYNSPKSPWGKYTVKQGDTLASIIQANGPAETPTYIMTYNQLAGITIPAGGPTPGQTIWLPAGNLSFPGWQNTPNAVAPKASAQSQTWAIEAEQASIQAQEQATAVAAAGQAAGSNGTGQDQLWQSGYTTGVGGTS